MELTRIIHPVGQGGFFSEKIKDGDQEINIIYDCGGNSRQSIEEYLANYYLTSFPQEIDAVFISHLHDDHVNGLEYLLINSKVKYLFLPQLNHDQQMETYLYNIIYGRSKVISNSFLQELYEHHYFQDTVVVEVPHSSSNQVINKEINVHDDIDILSQNVKAFEPGTKIYYKKEWLFILYNPPVITKKLYSFYDSFKRSLNIKQEFELSELPSIVEQYGIDRCKAAYKRYFESNHNAYSMALLSTPSVHDNYNNDSCIKADNSETNFIQSFLYMGDFETKLLYNDLKSYYQPFWERINSLQVPHHGSRNNYHPFLYEYPKTGFLCVGERNRYSHPNVDTLLGMKNMGCEPILVTESLGTLRLLNFSDISKGRLL